MGKKIILWSGGLDSTVLLYKLLLDATESSPIIAVTIDKYPQLDITALLKQKIAREKFVKRFKRLTTNRLKLVSIKMEIEDCNNQLYIDNTGLPQAAVWLTTISNFLCSDDTIYLGYIKEDDIWHHKSDWLDLFNSIMKLKNIENKIKVEFPFEWYSKYEILNWANHYKIPKTCYFYCENPTLKGKCKYCHSCIVHARAEFELKLYEKSKTQKYKTVQSLKDGS